VRIAYFSPLNPQPTGIADYSEELLPYLAHHAELDLFIDDYLPSNPAIVQQFEIYNYRHYPQLQRQRRYDVCLYHMGNSPFHKYIYHTLLRYPGVTVLHDYSLCQFFKALDCEQPAAYLREMGYCYGRRGFDVAHQAINSGQTFPDYDYPLVDRVIDASLGLIVHSGYVRRLIVLSHPNTPVAKVNTHLSLEALDTSPPDLDQLRASLGLQDDQFVVASFGRIAPPKRIDVALRAFARFRQRFPQAVYLLVGEVIPLYDIEELIQELGLENAVVLTGYANLDDFQHYLTIPDVCINLRYPTAGETSASLIRMMGVGKPVIVSDVDAFSELPDDSCIKVDVGPREEDVLLNHLLALAHDPALRRRMGGNAQRYVQTYHRPEDAAQAYVAFIERCLESITVHPRPARFSLHHPIN
jgi:glycosyltransferase involved in cell wall biosynthesis